MSATAMNDSNRREFLRKSFYYTAHAVGAVWALSWTSACTRNEEQSETDAPASDTTGSAQAPTEATEMDAATAIKALAASKVAQSLNYVETAEESKLRESLGAEAETRYCCNCNWFMAKEQVQNGKCPAPDKRAKCTLIPDAPVRAGGYCTSWTPIS